MKAIEELREKHKLEIKCLQDSCGHSNITDWIPYYWAPGHYSHQVKVCEDCGKIVEEDKPEMKLVIDGEEQVVKRAKGLK